ncbi:3874_t:CDS:2, partial [Funneliformis geosporum]
AASDKKVDADASSIPLESPSHPASLPRGMVKITICINLCPRRLKFINILQNDIKTLNFIHVINESPDYFNYGDLCNTGKFISSLKERQRTTLSDQSKKCVENDEKRNNDSRNYELRKVERKRLKYLVISPKDRVLELRALRMLATNDNI